jgi:hypothetical protein
VTIVDLGNTPSCASGPPRARCPGLSVRTAFAALLGLLLAMWQPSTLCAAEPLPVLTLLDGEASCVDGSRVVGAVVGLHASPGELITTSASAVVLRLEWADGSTLDLGPSTRVMMTPRGLAAADGKTPAFYLLQGWVKFGPATAFGGAWTAGVGVDAFKGTAVIEATPAATTIFAETGALRVLDRRQHEEAILLPGGQALMLGANAPAAVGRRADPAWMARVPRAFRDALPRRLDRLQGAATPLQVLPGPTYATLQPWLTAEAALRQDFPMRFAPLLKDTAFRDAVQSHLASHPEWEATLHAHHNATSR